MAKAIKHIRAGLLNIEVIGTVPDRGAGRKNRAGRCNPTSPAQQFYNDKCSWRELELMLAANFGRRDLVVTLTYGGDHLPPDKPGGIKIFQKFVRKLRESRKKRGEVLKYIYCTEGFHGKSCLPGFAADDFWEDKRIHHHAVINATGAGDLEELNSLWPGGGYIRIETLDVNYYRELAKYLTKEAREFGRAKPGERVWRSSRNLEKYEVEYIEIPSDSITLAPPFGAVNYEPFSIKNPYGYADCVGARYLLFPKEDQPEYSYTTPRRRKTE